MRGKSILLVEDNRDDEELTLDALCCAGVTNPVAVARDGAEALDYLFLRGGYAQRETGNPCVILLDLKLPKISGLEVLRRARTDARTRLIPIVVLTTSSEEEDVQQCLGNGANSFVRKPVEFDGFRDSVRLLGLYWTLVNKPADL